MVSDRAPRKGRQDPHACTRDSNDPASVFHARMVEATMRSRNRYVRTTPAALRVTGGHAR